MTRYVIGNAPMGVEVSDLEGMDRVGELLESCRQKDRQIEQLENRLAEMLHFAQKPEIQQAIDWANDPDLIISKSIALLPVHKVKQYGIEL